MIDTALFGLAGVWVLIWAVILVIMIVKKMSRSDSSSEAPLPKPHATLHRIQRYILWVFIVSFAIRMIAGFMGWAPPFPPQ